MPYYCKKTVKGHTYWGIQEAYRDPSDPSKVKTRYLMYIGAEKPDITVEEYLDLFGNEWLFHSWHYALYPASTKAEDLNFLVSYFPDRHRVSEHLEQLNDAQLLEVNVTKQKPYPVEEDFLNFDPSSIDPSLYELAKYYPITVSDYRTFQDTKKYWKYISDAEASGDKKAIKEAMNNLKTHKKFLTRKLFEITHPYIDGDSQRCWKHIKTGCKHPDTHPAYFGINFFGNIESELKRIGLHEHDFIGLKFSLDCSKTYLIEETKGKRTIAYYNSGVVSLPQMALWKHETTAQDEGDLIILDTADTEPAIPEKIPYRNEKTIRERHRTIIHETGHHVYRTYANVRKQWNNLIGEINFDKIKSLRRSLFDWRLRSDAKKLSLDNEAFAVSFVDYRHYTLLYPDESRFGNLSRKIEYDLAWITDSLKDIKSSTRHLKEDWDFEKTLGKSPSKIRKSSDYKNQIENFERTIRMYNSYRESYIYSQIRHAFFTNWDAVRWGLDGTPAPLPTYDELSAELLPEQCIEKYLLEVEGKHHFRGKGKLDDDTIGSIITYVIDHEPFAGRYLYAITSYGTTLEDALWNSTTDWSLYDKKQAQKKALRQILEYLLARMTDKGYVKFNYEKYTHLDVPEYGNWWHFSLAPVSSIEATKIGHSALERGFYLRGVYKDDELAAIDKDTLPSLKKRLQTIKTRKHKGSGYIAFSRAFYQGTVKKSNIIAEYRILQYAHAPDKTIIIEVTPEFRNDVWKHLKDLTIDEFDYNADPTSADIEIDTYAKPELAKLIRKNLYEDLYPMSEYKEGQDKIKWEFSSEEVEEEFRPKLEEVVKGLNNLEDVSSVWYAYAWSEGFTVSYYLSGYLTGTDEEKVERIIDWLEQNYTFDVTYYDKNRIDANWKYEKEA